MSLHREATAAEPIRVVVAGNSASYLVARDGPRRDAGNYGEQLVPLLRQAGLVADVRHSVQWFGMINDCRRDVERKVRNHFPDVLVLHYGIIECQPRVLPAAVSRQLMGSSPSEARLAGQAHAGLAHFEQPLRRLQTWGARWTGQVTWRMGPKRFCREFATVVQIARLECDALVLVVDLDPPGPEVRADLPGMGSRHVRFQLALAALVARLDGELGKVRLVTASEDVIERDAAPVLADGLHRTAAGHALLAARIARFVVAEAADVSRSA